MYVYLGHDRIFSISLFLAVVFVINGVSQTQQLRSLNLMMSAASTHPVLPACRGAQRTASETPSYSRL